MSQPTRIRIVHNSKAARIAAPLDDLLNEHDRARQGSVEQALADSQGLLHTPDRRRVARSPSWPTPAWANASPPILHCSSSAVWRWASSPPTC